MDFLPYERVVELTDLQYKTRLKICPNDKSNIVIPKM